MIDCEENADYLYQEWLESLTEGEMETRHFLLDREGVKARLHWFDWPHEGDYNDSEGRLDTEKNVFHYKGPYGNYSKAFPKPIKYSSGYLYVLIGTEGVIGEIIVENE